VNEAHAAAACRFCGIAAGHYGAAYDTPITASERYFSIASIGAFVPGWSLVCPRRHEHNLSAEYREPAFHDEISQVVSAVNRSFGRSVIFEHGSNRDESPTACGTSHAHLHVVPFVGSLTGLTRSRPLNWMPVHLSAVAEVTDGSEYLFAADGYEGMDTLGYCAILRTPTSQFFRRLIAAHLEVPHLADYRTAPEAQLSALTALRVREAVRTASRRAA
jgi:diadenosine tetraphosphate (Ap4A) HIT family hydrolase